jgi:hypothetical protein
MSSAGAATPTMMTMDFVGIFMLVTSKGRSGR